MLLVVLLVAAAVAVLLQGDALLDTGGSNTGGSDPPLADAEFVCASDDHFELGCGGDPWSPVGFDDYRLTSGPGGFVCDGATGEIDDVDLAARLDSVAATGANAVRTWFFQSYTDGGTNFEAFDRVLVAAAERNLRVIPVLVNDMADCELDGMPKDASFFESGYRSPGYGYALSFRDYASGIAANYRDEPTVAFWQLVNEAQAPQEDGSCNETRAVAALSGFATDMTSTLRAADPNHLISLGPMGEGSCGTAGDDYGLVQMSVDICGMHQYEELPDETETSQSQLTSSPSAFSALEQCGLGGLNKPIIAGEIGIPSDLDGSGSRTGIATDTTLARRAQLLDATVDAQAMRGLDGALVWQRAAADQPEEAASEYDVAPGDPIDDLIGGWAAELSGAG